MRKRIDDRAKQLEILIEITRIATLDLELRPMLQRVTDMLAQQFGWEFVACASLDHKKKRFTYEAVTAAQPTEVEAGYTGDFARSVIGEVATVARPIVLDDIQIPKKYPDTMEGTRSELCVPVLHRGELVAILNLKGTLPNLFADQLPLLQAIADQVAGAIHSARLFEEARRANRALAEANRQLEALTRTDGLTGVANRRHFDELLDREWRRAQRAGTSLALLMIDIDEFKKYNDHYGHQGGDDCLKTVAGALKGALSRASDTVARYGGEEFAVILPGSDQKQAIASAERLRQRVEQMAMAHAARTGGFKTVTISLGAASLVPREQDTPERLVSAADQALYAAKKGGRNRTCAAIFAAKA